MIGLLKRIFDPNEKELKRYQEIVETINGFEPEVEALSDEALRAKTGQFKERLAGGDTLDDILPEAFAVAREAAKRTIGLRPFDVQLIGGMALHDGRIAEMKTGEGKTLTATLPIYLNALAGKGVHLITVNDYLAKRDAAWMGSVYKFLGLTVGAIVHGLDANQRRAAYASDVTYGTNHEFGFDYLRDNLAQHPSQMVQRGLNFAIVDEVDSILIDEARTPLIISGEGEASTDLYYTFARVVPKLEQETDYTVDEKMRAVSITEEGSKKVEKMLGVGNIFDESHWELAHYLQKALQAHVLYHKDKEYVVRDGQVVIVDEFTGRLMFGRRYSDGLHQSIEAKEGVKIEREQQTVASITYQNYFRMYEKLAGMTGTAATEEAEFRSIYKMDVVQVPTNLPMIRDDQADLVFKTQETKFEAVVDEIAEQHQQGRPILVGTISIERSELISSLLKQRGVPHQVLNAKFHEREAEIVAQAGRLGAVTVATNMAGRGTDIVLGGNPDYLARQKMREEGFAEEVIIEASEKTPTIDPDILAAREVYRKHRDAFKVDTDAEREQVLKLGGLSIIGTERHESRRIDNQLRGRSGRQGDPGASRFFVSLEDDLMRIFGSDRIKGLMERFGWKDDSPIEHNQVSKAIENAQRKIEAHYFEARKNVLKYDDVMNEQRRVIYDQRRRVLTGENIRESILQMISREVSQLVAAHCPEKSYPEDWDLAAIAEQFGAIVNHRVSVEAAELDEARRPEEIESLLQEKARSAYEAREAQIGDAVLHEIERFILLQLIDQKWMDHLRSMDDLRDGIGLRAYGQKDPVQEYKFEAYEMFTAMTDSIQSDAVRNLFRIEVQSEEQRKAAEEKARKEAEERMRHLSTNRTADGAVVGGEAAAIGGQNAAATADGNGVVQRRVEEKVGRNDPCPCGSGKKYKKCHGAGEA
ncbi:MAG TPA: preprotein translocase subunit SecA [Limnochordia bacterium]|nr:preprotein translocase subunit SecA [Limnochordia bacterium]